MDPDIQGQLQASLERLECSLGRMSTNIDQAVVMHSNAIQIAELSQTMFDHVPQGVSSYLDKQTTDE